MEGGEKRLISPLSSRRRFIENGTTRNECLIREVVVQKVAVRPAPSAPVEPVFGASLARDADAAGKYFAAVEAALQAQKTERPHEEDGALKSRSPRCQGAVLPASRRRDL